MNMVLDFIVPKSLTWIISSHFYTKLKALYLGVVYLYNEKSLCRFKR